MGPPNGFNKHLIAEPRPALESVGQRLTIDRETPSRSIVIDGVLGENGVASFSTVLDAQSAEAIRAFVIAQAHATNGAS